jgi:hypothetical protein
MAGCFECIMAHPTFKDYPNTHYMAIYCSEKKVLVPEKYECENCKKIFKKTQQVLYAENIEPLFDDLD